MEVEPSGRGVGSDEVGPEGFEMRFVARRYLQDGRLGFEEILRVEPSPNRGRDAIAGQQEGAAVGEDVGSPGRRARRRDGEVMRAEELETLANGKKIGMVPPDLVEAGRRRSG